MPAIADVLAPQAVRLHVSVSSKRQLLHELAETAAVLVGAKPRTVLTALHERERLGSTGVGQGVALPHARVPGIDRLVGLFWQLDHPVPFEAIDDVPVDLVFLLIVPEGGDVDHLKTLARIARRLREADTRRGLREATKAEDAWRALAHDPTGRPDGSAGARGAPAGGTADHAAGAA